MSETERDERLGAQKRKDMSKKKGPPQDTKKGGEKKGDDQSNPGKFKRNKDSKPSLYPTVELEALELSSSDSEILDSSEEAELEEEAARYEEDRYHPDRYRLPKVKANMRPPPVNPAGVLPSAPPLYESQQKFGTDSFLPLEERRKLQMAFPVFDRGKGRACDPHCLEAWGAWGKPHILKTDNGPAYTSQKFRHFYRQMEVTHLTGLPYNPQGQSIVERAHRTLKSYLIKQKEGIGASLPSVPRVAISMALFTLNFLNIDAQGHTAAERHTSEPERPKEMPVSQSPHRKPSTSSVSSDEKGEYDQIDKENTQVLQKTIQEWTKMRQSSRPSKDAKLCGFKEFHVGIIWLVTAEIQIEDKLLTNSVDLVSKKYQYLG
ncbi:GRB2-associated-binding protein 2 [Cricetulus griseus]|nr:GRB2-associated-binding protein 2 [Cricetulus griseus]